MAVLLRPTDLAADGTEETHVSLRSLSRRSRTLFTSLSVGLRAWAFSSSVLGGWWTLLKEIECVMLAGFSRGSSPLPNMPA